MTIEIFATKPCCPLCGGEAHPVDRLWECPQVRSYSSWGESGGWSMEKYEDMELEFIPEASEE